MQRRAMKILVTNDDGIDARGLRVLVEALGDMDGAEVYAVAPKEQQSGKSHCVTFRREVHAEERELKGAAAAWAIDGTPADCVKWGLMRLGEDNIAPDFIFSGINLGHNLGLSAYYSGTVAAAREGALNGIHSIALSVQGHEAEHFDYVLDILPSLIEMSGKIGAETLLSVNAPNLPADEVKGMEVVPAAPFGYGEDFVFVRTESGDCQMIPAEIPSDGLMRYDFDWLRKGYTTVSPIPTTLEDASALSRLKTD